VPSQIKDFHLTLPDCLTLKHFMHGHSREVNRAAPMQLLNRDLKAEQVILSILHNV
jgi:hypothetical protein